LSKKIKLYVYCKDGWMEQPSRDLKIHAAFTQIVVSSSEIPHAWCVRVAGWTMVGGIKLHC